MSELLTEQEYKKILPIIDVLIEKQSITPKEAEIICGKSATTTRRYLGVLVKTGYVKVEGKSNRTIYRLV